MRINMKIILAMIEMHGEQKSHESQVVIAVKVTDEDMTDAVCADVRLRNLKLSTLAAVD